MSGNPSQLLELETEFRKIVIEELKAIGLKVEEAKQATSSLERKLDLHIQKTIYEFEKLEGLNSNLEKEGLTLQGKMESIEKRLTQLETPVAAGQMIKSNTIWVLTVVGLVLS